jgi:hypothetical protein
MDVTLSLALREGNSVMVFENKVMRRIFGPKREEVAGGWRRLHNEELHNLYASPNIIEMTNSWKVKCTGNLACLRMKNEYKILVR